MSGKALGPTMNEWYRARDFSDNFPEICPVCKEKRKHCKDYEKHLEEVSDGSHDASGAVAD